MERGFVSRQSFVVSKQVARMVLCAFLLVTGSACPAAAQPITTDSRIKTFVYNQNEVFAITTHYGYQSNIEFGPKEQIDTISVGDRVGWQIVPAGRRLFIRAMEENARTNMTVVTNLRAYQFDLRSSAADAVFGSEELTYVVRFFYPPVDAAGNSNYVAPVAAAPAPIRLNAAPVMPVASNTLPPASSLSPSSPAPIAPAAAPRASINYRYTYSGPSDIAPTKIYDDGRTTYFKLHGNQSPKVAILSEFGDPIDVPSRRTSDGLLAVDAVAPRFSLNQSGRQVIIYNEAGEV